MNNEGGAVTCLRRKPAHIAALPFFLLIVFISSYVVQFRAVQYRQHKINRRSLEVNNNNNNVVTRSGFNTSIHPSRRSLEVNNESNIRVQHPLQKTQFVTRSGFYPSIHPSKPYYVVVNDNGEYIKTLEDEDEQHPLNRLVDLREPRYNEPIFFFVVPRAKGGNIKTIMTKCYNLRRTEKRLNPESLTYIDGVLNVDTQTRKGLANARQQNLIDLGFVDVIATSYFLDGTMIFNNNHKGRAFTILQHPVMQAEKLFNSRDWGMNFQEYIESTQYIDNWVVRSLTNNKQGELTEDHLMVAKGILARKFFIGIADYLEETMKRFEMYYELKQSSDGCANKYLIADESPHTESKAFHIERGSDDWTLVTQRDQYDLMLYYYALEIFAKQGSTLFSRPYVDKTGKIVDFEEIAREKKQKEKALRHTRIFKRLIGRGGDS